MKYLLKCIHKLYFRTHKIVDVIIFTLKSQASFTIMKMAPLKSFIVVLLLGMFLVRGFVSVSTLYILLGHAPTKQELLMNTEEEKNGEKNSAKTSAEKEFINEYHSNLLIAPSYTIITNKLLFGTQHRIVNVFLPIYTPPPRA